ncbi:MAG: CinA family protein [Planctomycetota bacterium]
MRAREDAPSIAMQLVGWLVASRHRLVLAESCTCGLAAASIGAIPGASQVFCGSLVTYRVSSKVDWLSVPDELIDSFTAESPQTTLAMATAAMERTPDASIAAAITGHLGPDAPTDVDGLIHLAWLHRNDSGHIFTESIRLTSQSRAERQTEAATRLLNAVLTLRKTLVDR